MSTMTYTGRLVVEECCNCHIRFAFPEELYNDAKLHGSSVSFYCPNGHGQHYTKGEIQNLREELEREKRQKEAAFTREAQQKTLRKAAERQASAARGQVTKIKNRVKNGVCPCCNRHFENLERHMKGKHPEFVQEAKL